MSETRVVITGMGAVSPHGSGVDALWQGLLEGRSAVREITLFDASVFRQSKAGEVDGYPVLPDGPARALRMLNDACAEALRDALQLEASSDAAAIASKLTSHAELQRMAVVSGTNFGGMSAAETALLNGEAQPDRASLSGYLFGAAGSEVARAFGIGGPRINLSLSCASGAAAMGIACDQIRMGRVTAALACGYDELSLFIYAGLSALRAITKDTIMPFDVRRKGTLFSEGAGALLLESEASARARGATIYARIAGRYMNNDAYHMTAPEQEATGIQALMRAAMKDAGVTPEQIDHVNLHATGTPYNDKIETKALHGVFGARGSKIPVCSVKSSIGHTMGAAGLLESITAVKTLNESQVPPVVGLDPAQKDPECDLNTPTGAPMAGDYRTVLKTSYGFGGTNAAVVLAKA